MELRAVEVTHVYILLLDGTALGAERGLVQEGLGEALLHFGLSSKGRSSASVSLSPQQEFCWLFPGIKAGIPSPGFHRAAQLPQLPAALSHFHGISRTRSIKKGWVLGQTWDKTEQEVVLLCLSHAGGWGGFGGGFPVEMRESFPWR